MTHYNITTVDAATAAENIIHHCEHDNGGRTFRLSQSGDVITMYIHASSPMALMALGARLVEIAGEWNRTEIGAIIAASNVVTGGE